MILLRVSYDFMEGLFFFSFAFSRRFIIYPSIQLHVKIIQNKTNEHFKLIMEGVLSS